MISESKVVEIINSNAELTKIILNNSSKLYELYDENPKDVFLNFTHLLQAIAMQESTYGQNNNPRFEPAYAPGGLYYKATHVKNLYEKYGRDAACSWSSFQIMFITAFELGYREKPSDLKHDSIAIHWIIKYIEKRIFRFDPDKLEQIFDAYNSGSFRDKNIPKEYITNCLRYYEIIEKNFPILDTPIIDIMEALKPKTYTITEDALNEMINDANEDIEYCTTVIENRKSLIKYLTEIKEKNK